MTPKICISIIGETVEEVLKTVKDVEEDRPDLLEIRLDYLKGYIDLHSIRASTKTPLIATNRVHSEGGLFKGSEERRFKTLQEAAQVGFDFVDIELDTPRLAERISELREAGAKVIVSKHTKERPQQVMLERFFLRERKVKPDLCKIVTGAEVVEDNISSLVFLKRASAVSDIVCFCMGSIGRASRILSPLFGGAFTYAAIAEGKEAAPGQLTVQEMRRIYRLLGVDFEDNR
ncbi:MAG: type I 3-dehydroquinate dehydratase [Nitrososphaerota archaeon]